MTQENSRGQIDDAYIRERFGTDLPQEYVDNLRGAMQKYGENHWWELDDPVEIARYQVFESCLMTDLNTFSRGIVKIVGRPVFNHELRFSKVDKLREEVRLGLKRLERGIGTSDEYKKTAVRKSLQEFLDFCRRTGKTVLQMGSPEQSDERGENGIDNSGYDGWMN